MKIQTLALAALCTLLLAPPSGGAAATKKTSSSESRKSASTSEKTAKTAKTKKAERIPAAQAGARKLVSDLTTTQKAKMLTLLNEGSAGDLSLIKGVSETRGAAIEKARPFETLDEVILVNGIGKGTFAEIISHARSLTARKSSSPSKTKKS